MNSIDIQQNFALEDPILKKLCEEAQKDLTLGIQTILEKSLTDSAMCLKWWKILTSAQEKLKNLKNKRENTLKTKLSEFQPNPMVLRAVKEKQLSESLPEIVSMDNDIQHLIEVVGFLQGVYQIFQKFGFSIKNSLETLKLEKNI
jgi:hypothetical protein